MKTKILKSSILIAILGVALWSCKKDEVDPIISETALNRSQINMLDKSNWISEMGSHHNVALEHINQNMTIDGSITNGMNINEFNDYFDVIATQEYTDFSQNTYFQGAGNINASKPNMTNNMSHADMVLFQKNNMMAIKNQFIQYKNTIETMSSSADYDLSIEIINSALDYLDNPNNSLDYINGLNGVKNDWNNSHFENSTNNDGIFSASLLAVGIHSHSYWSNNIRFLQGTTIDSDQGDVLPGLPWVVIWDLGGVAAALIKVAGEQAVTGDNPTGKSIIFNVVIGAVGASIGAKYLKAARAFLGW